MKTSGNFRKRLLATFISTGARRLERSFLCTHRKLISTMLTSFPLTLQSPAQLRETAPGLKLHPAGRWPLSAKHTATATICYNSVLIGHCA